MSLTYIRAAVLLTAAGFGAATLEAQAGARRPMTFEDFAAVRNVGDPQLSPDGKWVLYSLRTTDVAANRRTTVTMLMPIAGGSAKQFPDANTRASEARWSPDGKRVAYSANGQLWIADASGANAHQITSVNGGASGPVWAPTSDRIAFVTGVYPDCDSDACNIERAKADTGKVKAHIADNLLYRHWTEWTPATRSHLFVVSPNGTGLRDVTSGVKYDVPPGPFGGSEAYAFSPDGKELTYSAKDQGRTDAWSTDVNLYTVAVSGGAPVVITSANKGADQNPVYSPDGRTILYASQARAGFESDRWRLMAYDRATGTSHELLPNWDRNADAYAFSPSGDVIYINAVDASRTKIYRITRGASGWSATPQLLTTRANNVSVSIGGAGRTIAWLQDATERPAEVYVATIGANGLSAPRQLTHENDRLLAQLKLYPVEDYWFKGADGDSVQGLLVKPPQYQPGKKFPVLFLIHGGPQGEWLDQWHGRWNFELFASPGFGIVAINPRGSFGYGQRFVDQISRDWGGKVYTDLMNGLDAALARNSWLDSTRMGAGGGSYGGYMTNWIAGHSNRFKALFTHAGVYNLENMYGATEEVWFGEWEYGGPYWNKTAMDSVYRRWSPHLFAANFHTPHLVVVGEMDYRVPYTEGLSLFTALQRQGVPSRLIDFPDEGHWIGKPQNQRLWWSEVLGWFTKYLNP